MAFKKRANFKVEEVNLLNVPTSEDWNIFNKDELVKTASINKSQDLGGFNIASAIKDNPDHLFVKVFAIKEDEVNDNGDYFSKEELKKATETFVGVPVFCNHENDDIEKARGKVVHSWYDEDMGGIYIISQVDKVAYPKLARGIQENFITGTSMGASIEYSVCSACHNKAHVADEFCSCIANRKGRKVNSSVKCAYHDSPSKPQDDCPVCGKSAGEENIIKHADSTIFEYNYGLKFIEDSFVVNPACHTCLVQEVLNPGEVHKKVASLNKTLTKLSSNEECVNGLCGINSNKIEKEAGAQELTLLAEAMDSIEKVTKSMMDQKRYVSMEYVADLVKTLSDIQATADELMEMGYSQLPSSLQPDDVDSSVADDVQQKLQQPAPQFSGNGQVNPQTQPQGQQAGQQNVPSATNVEQLDDMGTVTAPKFSSIKKEDFLDKFANIKKAIYSLSKKADKIINNSENNTQETSVMSEKNSQSNDDQNKVAKQDKVAKHDTDVINEKQLNDAELSGERWDDAPDTITQKQLDDVDEHKDANDTTSDSPQERWGSYDVITEKQIKSVSDDYVARWDDFPDVITQKQWNETSRMIGSDLDVDQTNVINEKQLLDFVDNHRYLNYDPDVVTEKQMGRGDVSERWASKEYRNQLMKAAMETISDTIAYYHKTPQEIKQAATKLNDSVEQKNKAAYLTLINALPHKKEARVAEKDRYNYFSKFASGTKAPSVVDSIITAMADNVGDLSADDLIYAVEYAANNEKALKKAEAAVEGKLNKEASDNSVSKRELLSESLVDLNKEADGIYKVEALVEEVDADIEDKQSFVTAAKKLASDMVSDEIGGPIDVELTELEVSDDNKVIVATVKDTEVLTASEKEALEKLATNPDDVFKEMEGVFESLEDKAEDDEKAMCGCGEEKDMKYMEDDDLSELEEPASMKYMEDEEEEPASMKYMEDDEFDLSELLDMGGEASKHDMELDEYEEEDQPEYADEDEDKILEELGFADMKAPKLSNENSKDKETKMSESELNKRAQKRKELIKQAQLLGGEMGGQGGVSQAPGAGATLPNPPGAMDQQPVESFEESDLGGEMAAEDEQLEPLPPGTACPVCTSLDLNIVEGKGQCNNCGSEFSFSVEVDVTKWSGLLGDDESAEEEGAEEDALAGEGFEMPQEGEGMEPGLDQGQLPAAASVDNDKQVKVARKLAKFSSTTKLTQKALKTAKENDIEIGSVSPLTGSTNTVKVSKTDHICLDTGVPYEVQFKKAKGNVYAKWSWNANPVEAECDSCNRKKASFDKALEKVDVSPEDFESMDWDKKAETILEMKKAGALDRVKTASTKSGSVLDEVKKVAGNIGDKFPYENCIEKVARRWGRDAVALSGPYEGQKLPECICNSLKKADVYSENFLNKVASVWSDKDGCEECEEDFVRKGYDLKTAKTVCQGLEMKYARFEDHLAEDLGKFAQEVIEEITVEEDYDPFEETDADVEEVEVMETEDVIEDPVDAIDDDIVEDVEEDSVTLELPLEVLEQIDEAIDVAQGENPELEDHHTEELPDVDVEVDVPEDAAEAVEDVAEDAMDEVVGEEESVEVDIEPEVEAPMKHMESEEKEVDDVVSEDVEEDLDELDEDDEVSDVDDDGDVDEEDVYLENRNEKIEEEAEDSDKSHGDHDYDSDEEHENTDEKGGSDVDETKDMKSDCEEAPVDEGERFKEGDDLEDKEASSENGEEVEKESSTDTDTEVEAESAEADKEASSENEEVEKESSENTDEYSEKEASGMRRGHISGASELSLDLESVMASLTKNAGKVDTTHAQDAAKSQGVDWDGKQTMGGEEDFSADDVKEHTGPATMGDEDKDLQKAEKADVPAGDARMGGESDTGEDYEDLDSEYSDDSTGGDSGQGGEYRVRTSSTKQSINELADKLINIQKEADKVERKQVQDDEDTKPYSGDSYMGKEKESIGEIPESKPTPDGTPEDNQMLGKEQESIGDKPDAEKDTPDVPNDDARMKGEKDNDKIAPEKGNEMTGSNDNGGVTASGSLESKDSLHKQAYKLAGKMLQKGHITVDQLEDKVQELTSYGSSAALQEIENAMSKSVKGLATPSDGLEKPVLINEASNERNAQDELTKQLSEMFSLSKRAREAERTNNDLFKANNR